ncbi:MAG: hypothetical protein ACI3WS_07500 [Phascolarctobacterium sp.]
MNEEQKEILRPLAVGIIALLIFFALSFCFLHNHRSGDAGLGKRIDSAKAIIGESRKQQSAITSGIEEAEREANSITATINQSYQQAERAESEVTAAGDAIRECRKSIERCQQLITTIRARAEPNPK